MRSHRQCASLFGWFAALLLCHAVATAQQIPLSACGTLDVEGGEYVLTNDVSSTDTCIEIGARHVTLDCNGYRITGAGVGSGINHYKQGYATIHDCNIENFRTGISMKDNRAYGSTVTGTTISHVRTGISLAWEANAVITDNVIDQADYGIDIYVDGWNMVMRNNISASVMGVALGSSWENTVINNTIIGAVYPILGDVPPFGNITEPNSIVETTPIECDTLACVDQAIDNRDDVKLTADLNGGVVVTRAGVTVDCDGHTLSGDGTGNGFSTYRTQGYTTIQNCTIQDFHTGIWAKDNRVRSTVQNCVISDVTTGISLAWEAHWIIEGNEFWNAERGVMIYVDGWNSVENNWFFFPTKNAVIVTSSSYNSVIGNTAFVEEDSSEWFALYGDRPGNVFEDNVVLVDSDRDLVADGSELQECSGTIEDDQAVEGVLDDVTLDQVNPNHFAWTDATCSYFQTNFGSNKNPEIRDYVSEVTPLTIGRTRGCSCRQILSYMQDQGLLGSAVGLSTHGCSKGVMEGFLSFVEGAPVTLESPKKLR